jgi:hypothetical protein
MKLKAKEILGSDPAPRSWSEIDVIAKAKPETALDISLQKVAKDVCQWWVQVPNGTWVPKSRLFQIVRK